MATLTGAVAWRPAQCPPVGQQLNRFWCMCICCHTRRVCHSGVICKESMLITARQLPFVRTVSEGNQETLSLWLPPGGAAQAGGHLLSPRYLSLPLTLYSVFRKSDGIKMLKMERFSGTGRHTLPSQQGLRFLQPT